MWRIADSGGIEQSDGSFLHQRTHTPDPEATFDSVTLSGWTSVIPAGHVFGRTGKCPGHVRCRPRHTQTTADALSVTHRTPDGTSRDQSRFDFRDDAKVPTVLLGVEV
jgi:hypothetical protein